MLFDGKKLTNRIAVNIYNNLLILLTFKKLLILKVIYRNEKTGMLKIAQILSI